MRVVLCQTKNGLLSAFRFLHEVSRVLDQHLVKRGHVVFGAAGAFPAAAIDRASRTRSGRERAFINNPLLADLAPARLNGLVVLIRRVAVDQIAREELVSDAWVGGIGVPVWIRHGV